jgi:hypothetical protein
MKYFKITNLTTKEDHYVSSNLPNETPTHVLLSAHVDTEYKYVVTEVTAKEFYGYPPKCIDFDVDEDEEDDDDEFLWD